MRGKDEQQLGVFSYISPEQRIPHDHPLRQLRVMADEALRELQPRLSRLYATTGRPWIAPEKLLRALLLQVLYSVRSERMLMEQLDYSLDVAQILRVPRSWVYSHLSELPAIRLGRYVRFRRSDIQRFLEKRSGACQ